MARDVRWKQRLENFGRAVTLLAEPLARDSQTLSALEREGVIQRFKVALELAWKALKDHLEGEGLVIEPKTPRNVIRCAVATRVLSDDRVWMDMIDQRNLLSHTFDCATAEQTFGAIRERYFEAIVELYRRLLERSRT